MRALLLALAALTPAPATPPGALVDARAATPVKALGSAAAWSAWDPGTDRYELQLLRGTEVSAYASPSQPMSAGPLDLDLGPDTRGRQLLVFSQGGHLAAEDLLTRRTRALAPPPAGASDEHPTVWRGRVAWARRIGVETRVLLADDPGDAPTGSAASASVPDADPAAAGAQVIGGLVPRGASVAELELAGNRLAAITVAPAVSLGAAPRTRLRVVDLRTRRVRTVAEVGGGQDRRTLTGASFVRGTLRYRVGCPAGERCGETAAWAYDVATATFARAGQSGEAAGWAALPDNGAVQAGAVGTGGDAALGCFDPRESGAAFSCPVRRVPPLRFRLTGS